jgi:alkanesulfonate monooxygenase SsuD/methylene tetrahydromethanopterin reductase-like flavin-dependent oxidoreductase (luciferase family)
VTNRALGPIGIATGLDSTPASLAAAATAEELGYPSLWFAGGLLPGLQTIVDVIQATSMLKVASGIRSVDKFTPDEVAATYAGVEADHPGRFVVGLGGAHGPKPLATLNRFLDRPTGRRTGGGAGARGAWSADVEVGPGAHGRGVPVPGHAGVHD